MRAVRDFLGLQRGIYAVRLQSGAAVYTDASGRRRLVKMCEAGTPDWLIITNGRPIFIECKSSTGRQTETQRQTQHKIEQAGAVYCIIRTIDELRQVLNDQTKLPR